MKTGAFGFWIIGAILIAFSFFMETTAPYSDTLNLGLLQNQLMLWQAGLAFIICGSVIFAVGALIEEFQNAEILPKRLPDGSRASHTAKVEKVCDHCDMVLTGANDPCSNFSDETIRNTVESLTSDRCIEALKRKKIVPDDYVMGERLT